MPSGPGREIGSHDLAMPAAELLAEGKRRPLLLWDGWRMARLSAPEETPWICQDANTPEEFQKAKTYFQTKKE